MITDNSTNDLSCLQRGNSYAERLDCKYCILTNGEEIFCFYLDAEYYIELETVLSYREMLKNI